MIVGTRGLGVGPENKPEEGKPSRINTYDRYWLAKRVTHIVDNSGRYTTELELVGASTDSSKYKPWTKEGAQATFGQLVRIIAESGTGPQTFWEKLGAEFKQWLTGGAF